MRPPAPHLLAPAAAALVAALAAATCGPASDPVHPSYDRCAAPEPCGLMTTCRPATLTTADAGASHCTVACRDDADCPGFNARCVPPAGGPGAGEPQCYRGCASSDDCRPGASCHGVMVGSQRAGVCVPDTGPRRCRTEADCAPLADVCVFEDAGAPARDASAPQGSCRLEAPR